MPHGHTASYPGRPYFINAHELTHRWNEQSLNGTALPDIQQHLLRQLLQRSNHSTSASA